MSSPVSGAVPRRPARAAYRSSGAVSLTSATATLRSSLAVALSVRNGMAYRLRLNVSTVAKVLARYEAPRLS